VKKKETNGPEPRFSGVIDVEITGDRVGGQRIL